MQKKDKKVYQEEVAYFKKDLAGQLNAVKKMKIKNAEYRHKLKAEITKLNNILPLIQPLQPWIQECKVSISNDKSEIAQFKVLKEELKKRIMFEKQ